MAARHIFVAQSHYTEAVLNKFHSVPDANTENTTVGMERRLSFQHPHWETYNHPHSRSMGSDTLFWPPRAHMHGPHTKSVNQILIREVSQKEQLLE